MGNKHFKVDRIYMIAVVLHIMKIASAITVCENRK